jgi:hypothetical protein
MKFEDYYKKSIKKEIDILESQLRRIKSKNDDDVLESMDIKVIEAFLRRKKLAQLKKDSE